MKEKSLLPLKITLILLAFSLLTGCWSSSNIQDQHYLTAIGIDYDEENFYLYGQLINFANIARTDSAQMTPPGTGTYVGVGKGITLNLAAANLYETAQTSINWGQVQAVVLTERAINTLDSHIVERLYRYAENRYNTWVYVTNESLTDLLTINSFFNLTSLFTILHSPLSTFKQYSILPPIQMFKYIATSGELAKTSYVPRLSIDKEQWINKSRPMSNMFVSGAYFANDTGHSKIFARDELQGYHWLDPHMQRTMLPIVKGEDIYASLTFNSSKIKIIPKYINGEAKFVIKATYKGAMHEYIKPMSNEEMMAIASEEIKKNIMNVFLVGIENELDIFNLMYEFRLKHPVVWKKITKNGLVFALDEKSIEKIEIHLNISSNGRYKRKL